MIFFQPFFCLRTFQQTLALNHMSFKTCRANSCPTTYIGFGILGFKVLQRHVCHVRIVVMQLCALAPWFCIHNVVEGVTQLVLLHTSIYKIYIGIVGRRHIRYAHLFMMMKD